MKQTNIMKKLVKTTVLLGTVLALLGLSSCTNELKQPSSKSGKKDKSYLVIDVGDISRSVSTIKPDVEANKLLLTNLELKGATTSSGTKTRLAGDCDDVNSTLATISSQTIALDPGTWYFTLTAKINDVEFSGDRSTTLTAGVTSTLSFTLTASDASANRINITVTFNDKDAPDSEVTKVVATLKSSDKTTTYTPDEITTFEAAETGYRKLTYNKTSLDGSDPIDPGTYYLDFEFFAGDSTHGFVSLNTLPAYVRVASGLTTTANLSIELNEVYTITYNDNNTTPGTLADGQTQQLKFSSKKAVTLPVLKHDTDYFAGWCLNDDFSDTPKMTLPKGTKGDTPVYAKWIKYSVGDVLLNDGSFVPYGEITAEQATNVVGVVYNLDHNNAPMGVIGLKEGGGSWAADGTTGQKTKFEPIVCTPSNSNPTTATFTGDTDGSDNWAYICSIDPEGTANAATNYPVFNSVNNYATSVGLTGDYAKGWYIPSLAELCAIFKNKGTISNAFNAIISHGTNTADVLRGGNYWSSSQVDISGYLAWYVDFGDSGDIKSSNTKEFDLPWVRYVRSAKPVLDYSVIFTASGGPSATVQTVQSGSTATEPTMPQIVDYTFSVWYSDSSYTTPFDFDTPITNHTILYGKWTHNIPSLTVLPLGTDGTAGTSATYAYFGEWPQTIKADDVTIDETTRFSINDFECYVGSDGYVYVKCTETVQFYKVYTYSNGITIDGKNGSPQAQVRYFKIEPIKWRVITQDYNSSGKALLLAENVLTGGVPYFNGDTRTIAGNPVYPNNYKYSTIRAYLNGAYETEDIQLKTYEGKGFLQKAFDSQSQSMIAITDVDNSAASTADTGGVRPQNTAHACENTNDKIFLLSLYEATTADYGFAGWDDPVDSRIRMAVDYSQANSAINDEIGTGGGFYLRSPMYNMPEEVYAAADGEASYTAEANYVDGISVLSYGIVPAFTIALENVDYTVQFNSNGGSDVSSQTIATGQTATEPATAPTKDGYSFAGWYSDVGLTTQFNFSTPITNHTILYAKWNYAVGTLLLNDGTFVAYSAASPFTTDQIQNAVGIVIDFDSSGAPKTVLGLKHGASLNWAVNGTTGYSTKFENILCTITPEISANYSKPIADIISMSGDESGSDNWTEICAADTSASANAATNYPAFNYANNYGSTAGLTGEDYATGWFIPSLAEILTINNNYTKLSQVISAINDVQSGAADEFGYNYYCTSSQSPVNRCVWTVQFSNGGNVYNYYKTMDFSVCCIHTIQ